MTDEADKIYWALRKGSDGVRACSEECLLYDYCTEGTTMTRKCVLSDAADLIEQLTAKVDELERQNAELIAYGGDKCKEADILGHTCERLTADHDRWKQRAEAAERDINDMLQTEGGNLDLCHWCKGACSKPDEWQDCSKNGWRGPCPENCGGDANA